MTALLSRIAAAGLLLLALVAGTGAAPLDAGQRSAIAERVSVLDAGMRASDMSQVMGLIPPKVMDKIASSNGMTSQALIEASQQQIAEALKTIKIESFSMDLDAAEATLLPDGTSYVSIPTETVFDLGPAGRQRSKTTTLALLDEGVWYLMAVDNGPQLAIVKDVYPALAGVEIPAVSMEPVTE